MASGVSNPYSPPERVAAPRRRAAPVAATLLVGVLLLVFALRAFRASWYALLLLPPGAAHDFAVSIPGALPISWAATRALLVLAIASFCFWVYRANQDARSLGADELSFTPAWAAGIGFIPVANLVGPYRAVKELYQASSPHASDRLRSESVPAALPLWWLFWLASVAWNLVPGQALVSSLVLQLLRGIAALMLIVVVRGVEHRQMLHAERGTAAIPAPAAKAPVTR